MQERERQVQAVVATILSRVCAEPLHGPRVVLLLKRLLPPGHVIAIQVDFSYSSVEQTLHALQSSSCQSRTLEPCQDLKQV